MKALIQSSTKGAYLPRQSQKYVQQNISADVSVFLVLDDTITQKTKHLSRENHPTESCSYHFLHKNGKSVWGYQVVQLMLKIRAMRVSLRFSII